MGFHFETAGVFVNADNRLETTFFSDRTSESNF